MITPVFLKPAKAQLRCALKLLCLVTFLTLGWFAAGPALKEKDLGHSLQAAAAANLPMIENSTGARMLASGNTWEQLARLIASDAGGDFGYSVAVSGDTLVVGAQGDDERAGNAGAVYVFTRPSNGWTSGTETAKLTASDAAIGDGLGGSVAISGNTILAGASGDDDHGSGSGSVYVFVKSPGGWVDDTETAKLTASAGIPSAEFGISVGISDDSIVIGARRDNENGENAGSAYVFVQPPGGWASGTETAKLTASDGEAGDLFGNAVSIDGTTIVVGAHGEDAQGSGSGAAYIFKRSTGGWSTGTETAKLTAGDGETGDFFGIAVAVYGDTVVVGASGDDVGTHADQGSVYVFVGSGGTWLSGSETAKLTASDGAPMDEFGKSVSVSGDVVVVGAHWDDWGSSSIFNEGSAYMFHQPGGGWVDGTETIRLTASDGEFGDEFGTCVALDGETLVIGSYRDDVDGQTDQGSAYVFALFEATDFLFLPVIRR